MKNKLVKLVRKMRHRKNVKPTFFKFEVSLWSIETHRHHLVFATSSFYRVKLLTTGPNSYAFRVDILLDWLIVKDRESLVWYLTLTGEAEMASYFFKGIWVKANSIVSGGTWIRHSNTIYSVTRISNMT